METERGAELNTTQPRKIIIIGAGAVGAAAALNLRRKGFEATIIDRTLRATGVHLGTRVRFRRDRSCLLPFRE